MVAEPLVTEIPVGVWEIEFLYIFDELLPVIEIPIALIPLTLISLLKIFDDPLVATKIPVVVVEPLIVLLSIVGAALPSIPMLVVQSLILLSIKFGLILPENWIPVVQLYRVESLIYASEDDSTIPVLANSIEQ